jgi:hypothetical protein
VLNGSHEANYFYWDIYCPIWNMKIPNDKDEAGGHDCGWELEVTDLWHEHRSDSRARRKE